MAVPTKRERTMDQQQHPQRYCNTQLTLEAEGDLVYVGRVRRRVMPCAIEGAIRIRLKIAAWAVLPYVPRSRVVLWESTSDRVTVRVVDCPISWFGLG